MSLSSGSWSSVPDSTSENSDGIDSSNIERMTTIVDNKVLVTCPFCGVVLSLPLPPEDREVTQEVDQEITSHSTEDSQSIESHQLPSPPKTNEDGRVVDGNEGLKEKRKSSSAETSALPKKKKADP